ncbi:MAG: response regulator [Clostridia bacterium]|nr:response regulator [Clostridia bacterium]
MKIIVVDDEAAALETFLPIVTDADFTCKLFRDDPMAALDTVRTEKIDAAVLDIRMPKIDGVTLAEQMLAADPALNIILLSAYPQNETELRAQLGDRLAGFLYKPYDAAQVNAILSALTPAPDVRIRTFRAFDVFINGLAVRFDSSKAKELLALLTDANGSFVAMDEAIDKLWPNKDAEHGKRLYRDAVSRLKLTLKQNGLERLVRFERAQAAIDARHCSCDLWTLLEQGGTFHESYLPQYDWALETDAALHARFGGSQGIAFPAMS